MWFRGEGEEGLREVVWFRGEGEEGLREVVWLSHFFDNVYPKQAHTGREFTIPCIVTS